MMHGLPSGHSVTSSMWFSVGLTVLSGRSPAMGPAATTWPRESTSWTSGTRAVGVGGGIRPCSIEPIHSIATLRVSW